MDRILGQEHAVELLQSAMTTGRIHHAWIFSGPQGVGKFTTAVEFARLLLDPSTAPSLTGQLSVDPATRVQQMIDAGSHPDLHIIRKELALYSDNPALRSRKLLNIPVDLLREKMLGGRTSDDRYHEAAAYRTAALGHAKVFIIDEAELLDTTAQNTLLKTLEEPPAETFFVLVTSRPERMLPTIHSRCQHIRFRALGDADMKAWFARGECIAGADGDAGTHVDADAQAWLMDFAAGAPGVAAMASEYGFVQWYRELRPLRRALAEGRYPMVLGETMSRLVDEFAQQWTKAHQNASKDAANKDGARHLLSLMSSLLRKDLAEACETGDADTREMALASIDRLLDAERSLATNVSMKLVFEHLAVQWTECAAGTA
jgi:DNA polymerase-3 subunit delta'